MTQFNIIASIVCVAFASGTVFFPWLLFPLTICCLAVAVVLEILDLPAWTILDQVRFLQLCTCRSAGRWARSLTRSAGSLIYPSPHSQLCS